MTRHWFFPTHIALVICFFNSTQRGTGLRGVRRTGLSARHRRGERDRRLGELGLGQLPLPPGSAEHRSAGDLGRGLGHPAAVAGTGLAGGWAARLGRSSAVAGSSLAVGRGVERWERDKALVGQTGQHRLALVAFRRCGRTHAVVSPGDPAAAGRLELCERSELGGALIDGQGHQCRCRRLEDRTKALLAAHAGLGRRGGDKRRQRRRGFVGCGALGLAARCCGHVARPSAPASAVSGGGGGSGSQGVDVG